MRPRRCVILEHRHRGGRHWDLLIEHPAGPLDGPAPLWAARLPWPPARWPATPCRLLATPLPDHRRRYLRDQGPLTHGRGAVRRVDQGHARPRRWCQGRASLTLHLTRWHGRVELRHLTPDRLALSVYPDATA